MKAVKLEKRCIKGKKLVACFDENKFLGYKKNCVEYHGVCYGTEWNPQMVLLSEDWQAEKKKNPY